MAQQFDFSPSFILAAITSRHFVVPQYQRSYAWTDVNLIDFWADMHRSIQDGGEYFLGSFVLSKEDSQDFFSIIDGQQRIATTTILLAAMRDSYRENGEIELANSFDSQFLQQHDVVSNQYRRRLRLNGLDNPFYEERVIDTKKREPAADSHKRIAEAIDFFAEKLRTIVNDNPETWKDKFASITKYLQSQARVVVVETATDADAYTIFETLNDRGADLTIADLLKNYLLSRAKNDIDSVRTLWTEALTILEDVQNEKDFVFFLRQLWSSYYGVTRERDLYRSIKNAVASPKQALDFAQQLKNGAIHYRAILSPDSDFWNGFAKSTRDHLSVLGGLSLAQVRPLLLSILGSMPKAETERVIRNLTSWGTRIIVAGTVGGGQIERYYSDAAVAVRQGEITNAEDLLRALQPVIPNDAVFKNSFSNIRVNKNSQARYFLCAIEKFLRGEVEPELILNEDAKEVNLEHILPQKPAKNEWGDFSSDEATAYAYRLGNMTLLRRRDNARLGNGEWPLKRAILAKSDLHLNKAISSIERWDKDTIDIRQDELADAALKVWPLLS